MSLDVYLTSPNPEEVISVTQRIYVRREGALVELSRAEWDELYPGREPVVYEGEDDGAEVYWANITHNMTKMASECGLFDALWQPEEIGASRAGDLIEPLTIGLARMRVDRLRLQEFNPKNGWGDYEGLLRFVESYLEACQEHPEAQIRVSR